MTSPKNTKMLKLKGILVLLTFLISLFLFSLAKETYRNYKINNEIKNLKTEIDLLKNENFELDTLINYLKTEKFVEKEARLKLGMQKPSEKIFIIGDQDENNRNEKFNEKNINLKISTIEKWKLYFFDSN